MTTSSEERTRQLIEVGVFEDLDALPSQWQDMVRRIAYYQPILHHGSTLPGCHIGFSRAFFAENQLLLGDLRIDISWQDAVRLFRLALQDKNLTFEVENWDAFHAT